MGHIVQSLVYEQYKNRQVQRMKAMTSTPSIIDNASAKSFSLILLTEIQKAIIEHSNVRNEDSNAKIR